MAEYNGKLYIAASNPGPIPSVGVGSLVFEFDEGIKDWHVVSPIGFGNPQNAEIYYLAVFNNCMYASTVNFNTGYEVWKTDGTKTGSLFNWTPVVKNGFGDGWNQYGMTMEVFGDYLYVGTAVGQGEVMKNGQAVGSRPFEIIRINKQDQAELIVGNETADQPLPGGPDPRTPLSGKQAGFGNPFNVYAWDLAKYQGCLYLGTLDLSNILLKALVVDPSLLKYFADNSNYSWMIDAFAESKFAPMVMEKLYETFGGGEIWRSCDGINWFPVTINGLDNPKNYGIRNLVPYRKWGLDLALAVGTANPFTGQLEGGCEVWLQSLFLR